MSNYNNCKQFDWAPPYCQVSNLCDVCFLHKFLRGKTMKRKFKLITSVASLCIAIALMAFGVYAASAPKLTVSGTVSFGANNVYATVALQKGTGASLEGISLSDVAVTNNKWEAGTSESDPQATADVTATLNDTETAYKYVVTITSDFDASSSAKVKGTVASVPSITTEGLATGAATLTVTYSVNGEDKGTLSAGDVFEIDGAKTAVITVTYVIDPAIAPASVAADMGLVIDFVRA